MTEILTQWGQAAGIAGMAFGVILLIYREIIRKDIFPRLSSRHATRILTFLIFLTFGIAFAGIVAWFFTAQSREKIAGEILMAIVTKAHAGEKEFGAGEGGLRYKKTDLIKQLPRFEKVLADTEQIISQFSPPRQRREAERALQRGDAREAIAQLRRAAQADEQSAARARRAAASLLEFSGRYDEALAEYSRAAELSQDPDILSDAIILALNIGKSDYADSLIRQRMESSAPRVDGGYLAAFYDGLQGISLWYRGQNTEAKEKFDRALPVLRQKKTIFLAQVLNDSSAVYDSIGKIADARMRAKDATQIYRCELGAENPRTYIAGYNFVALLIREGYYAEAQYAIEMVGFGVASDDWLGNARKNLLLGQMAMHAGKGGVAVNHFSRAQRIFMENGRIGDYRYGRVLRFLGQAYLMENDHVKAENFLQESFAINQKISTRTAQETLVLQALLSYVDAKEKRLALAVAAIEVVEQQFPLESKRSYEFALVLEIAASIHWEFGAHAQAIDRQRRSCDILSDGEGFLPGMVANCLVKLIYYLEGIGSREADQLPVRVAQYRAAGVKRSHARFDSSPFGTCFG